MWALYCNIILCNCNPKDTTGSFLPYSDVLISFMDFVSAEYIVSKTQESPTGSKAVL